MKRFCSGLVFLSVFIRLHLWLTFRSSWCLRRLVVHPRLLPFPGGGPILDSDGCEKEVVSPHSRRHRRAGAPAARGGAGGALDGLAQAMGVVGDSGEAAIAGGGAGAGHGGGRPHGGVGGGPFAAAGFGGVLGG